MRYCTIPHTDLTVSALCMGTGNIGSTIDRPTSFTLLDLYAEAGGNFLDTASVYADWHPGGEHVSEKTLGDWLADRGCRDQFIVATKGAHPDLSTMHIPRMSRLEIENDLNASLANLRTDVIDLYWLHRDDPTRPVEEILTTLNAQVQAGKIRYFGCSNWRTNRIRAAQKAAQEASIDGFVANQMQWSAALVEPARLGDATMVPMDDELYAYHAEAGLAAIPYSAQAGGLFQKLDRHRGDIGTAYPIEPNQKRLAVIQAIGRECGLSLTQVVLGYLTGQPFVTVPIVGSRTRPQLADTLTAADVRLSAEQVARIDAAL